MKSFREILTHLGKIITPAERKKSGWIVLLMIFNAILDFFSLASFLPLLFLIIKPEIIHANQAIHTLYGLLGVSSQKSFVIILTVAVLTFVLLKNQASRWIATVKSDFAFGVSQSLSSRALADYLTMNYLSFSQIQFSKALNRITNYPLAFANNIVLPAATLVSEVGVSVLILVAISVYDLYVFILLLLVFLPILFLYRTRRKTLKKISDALAEKYPDFLKKSLQAIEGFPEIKSMGKEKFFYSRYTEASTLLSRTFATDNLIQSGTLRLTESVVAIMLCALIVFSVVVSEHYTQTLLLIGLYAGACFRVIPSLNRILHAAQQIRTHEHILDEFSMLAQSQPIPPIPSGERMSFQESITFNNVSFSYPERPPILQNLSLRITKGQKVGLTGKSGSGKTTLLLILLRFLKETTGQLLIDGHQIQNEMAWRAALGYVPQTPYILDGTIAENIAFGISDEYIDRKKITYLLEELDLLDVVNQLGDGMDTRIGERGVSLSGGQRQRIAIARALYADADVLVLDEITNQVHSFMELEIMKILERLAQQQKTIVLVTHKLIQPEFFDAIYRLVDGRLIEERIISAANHH